MLPGFIFYTWIMESNLNGLSAAEQRIRSSVKTLFIVCGYPYSGKSYITDQLVHDTGAVLVRIDNIFHSRGFEWGTNKLPNSEEWRFIFEESYILTREALQKGRNVLYDSTNQTVASRDRLREVAQSVNANAAVIYIKSDIQTVLKRREESARLQNRHLVDEALVEQTVHEFEEPDERENAICIEN